MHDSEALCRAVARYKPLLPGGDLTRVRNSHEQARLKNYWRQRLTKILLQLIPLWIIGFLATSVIRAFSVGTPVRE